MKRNVSNCADELFASLIAMSANNKPLHEMTLVDYGGGTGMLSMQAKRMGVHTVIYCDLDSKWNAQEIAHENGLEANHYVVGDIDDLVNYCIEHSLTVDAIVSHDVIEHIVDLEYFAKRLIDLPHKTLTCILSSGANMYNPLILYRILLANHKIRKTYKISSRRSPACERLMRISFLKSVFEGATIQPGYYTRSNWRRVMNPLIRVLRYMVAPYYVCRFVNTNSMLVNSNLSKDHGRVLEKLTD